MDKGKRGAPAPHGAMTKWNFRKSNLHSFSHEINDLTSISPQHTQ